MRKSKRMIISLALVIVALVLSSCQRHPSPRLFTLGELTYQGEIQGNAVTYKSLDGRSTILITSEPDPNRGMSGSRYRVAVDDDTYYVSGDYGRVELTLPDGREIGKTYSSNGHAGYVRDHVEVSFAEWDLVDQFRGILYSPPKQRSSRDTGLFTVGLLMLGSGILSVTNPRLSWFLNRGWMFRDAEPSELYLGLSRVGGVALIILGLFAMFGGLG